MTESRAETRLMNKAVHYLGRYSASRQRLREVLGRFAMRKLEHLPPVEVRDAIEVIVEKCVSIGYVDDAQFAASQARSQRRQGRSALGIKQRLSVHRLDEDIIKDALDGADEGVSDGELMAAIRFAKRRRFGPFQTNKSEDPAKRQRQMASLARAGFVMKICRQVMDLEDEIAAEDLQESLTNEANE